MLILGITLSALLFASMIANVYFYLKSKNPKIVKNESIELQEFLADLMSVGSAVIAVTRIDPSNILIRSPRQK